MSNLETSQTIQEKIKNIQTLRETKGKEGETLEFINEALSQAEEEKDWGNVVTLHWESALVWQHTVMNEMAKPEEEQNPKAIQLGKDKMFEFAKKAFDVDEEKNEGKNKGVCLRFLGRAADYKEDYAMAKKYYEKGIEALPKDSRSILELRAFKAFSTTMMGDVDEGMAQAHKVFDDFFDSDMGKNLKEEDYFVWAVWMSGIAPRQMHALETLGVEYDSEEMKKWLEATKNELENPSGEVTWGDDKFQFRIDELNSSLGKIAVLILIPILGMFLN